MVDEETQAAPGKVHEQKVNRELRFKLTDEEKNKMGNQAATLTEERNTIKTELDIYGRTKRKEIKDMQKEIDRLLKCHKDGTEMREVEAVEVLDWENKQVKIYFNNELMVEREMHDSELQMKLNGTSRVVDSGKKPKKKTRAEKNPDVHLTPEEQKSAEIASVHKMETSRKTKKSAVDQASDEESE